MKACVLLLPRTSVDVADAIYSALWKMSNRAEVTIFVRDAGGSETIEFMGWESGLRQ